MKNNSFEFKYSAPTETERREIESIRRQYEKTEDGGETDKLIRLRRLHKSNVRAAMTSSFILGVLGTLVFGMGLSLVLEFSQILVGTIISAVGILLMIPAYPVYKWVLKSKKKKHGEEILRLSAELLGGDMPSEQK